MRALVADGRAAAVAGVDFHAGVQAHQFLHHGNDQVVIVGPGQLGVADGAGKQGVSTEELSILPAEITDAAGGVAGGRDDLEGHFAEAQDLAVANGYPGPVRVGDGHPGACGECGVPLQYGRFPGVQVNGRAVSPDAMFHAINVVEVGVGQQDGLQAEAFFLQERVQRGRFLPAEESGVEEDCRTAPVADEIGVLLEGIAGELSDVGHRYVCFHLQN